MPRAIPRINQFVVCVRLSENPCTKQPLELKESHILAIFCFGISFARTLA